MNKLLSLLLVAVPSAALAVAETKLADLLDLPASDQVTWGQRYEHGEGVARDIRTAVHLYCAAVRAGNAEAAYRLGWLYMNGRGVARDDDLAAAWLRAASAADHKYARRTLKHLKDTDSSREAVCIAPVKMEEIAIPLQPVRSSPMAEIAVTEPGSGADSTPAGEVEAMVQSWATAWSQRDADAYLEFYSEQFRPQGGATRKQWEHLRRARVTTPEIIELAIDELQVTAMQPGRVQVRFAQSYRSDRFADRVVKQLVLVLDDGGWKIEREHVR